MFIKVKKPVFKPFSAIDTGFCFVLFSLKNGQKMDNAQKITILYMVSMRELCILIDVIQNLLLKT